jgi:ABC-type branched-subunit amino acid transport system permease subunit
VSEVSHEGDVSTGDGPASDTTPGGVPGARIGVDSWVAQSGERLDLGTGWRRSLRQVERRVGWWPRLAACAVLGVVAGHFLLTNGNLQQVAFNSMLYALLALGLNIAVGWAGLLDLGYIAFFGCGAYGFALLSSTALGHSGTGGLHLPAIEIIAIVMVGTGIVGVLVGLVALRLEGDYLAIVTLFVGQAFVIIVNNFDQGVLGGVNGLFGLDPLHDFGGKVTSTLGYYYVGLGAVVVVAAALHLLDTSRTGRAWRALRDDPLAAGAMTIPVNKLKVMAFSFAAAVGALAGVLFTAQESSVFPTNFSSNVLILIYACLVLGGAGSIGGAILGGIVVTAAEQMLSSPIDAGYLFYGVILLYLIVRIRPWRLLAAVLGGIAALGVVARAIVGAISHSATAGQPGSGGWIGSLAKHWVIVPAHASTYGNVLFMLLIVLVLWIVRLQGARRLLVLVPTVYLAACCWESRLIVNPAITTQLLIGALLIVMMAARPQGLLGTRRVEVV